MTTGRPSFIVSEAMSMSRRCRKPAFSATRDEAAFRSSARITARVPMFLSRIVAQISSTARTAIPRPRTQGATP